MQITCFNCKSSIDYKESVGRRDECPKCRSDVHVCKNCKHYDIAAYNECREPSAEVVRIKDRANFCDYFSPKSSAGAAAQSTSELMKAAEALFKKNN